jgi:penicillin-binding protein 1A
VLASAVNKPIILLTGNDKLNEVRLDRWRYITEVRARICAEQLLTDEIEKKQVLFELIQLASGPPDPRVKPKLQAALDQFAPALAKRAQANPAIRANALIPAARFGIREEMKQAYGFGWREHVRGVTTTLDVNENLAFHERIKAELARVDAQYQSRLNSGFTLDPAKITGEKSDRKIPNVVVVAANAKGEIVRYFETGETAPYFGSPFARDAETGRYHVARESRHIASTGKILLAIGLANEHRDSTETLYADSLAPERGLETCEKGGGALTQGRKALVSFACSLNRPLEWRAAQLGQERIRRLIETFQFALPPGAGTAEATPPSTAAVRGLISGAPRRVHQMAGVVLAALTDQGGKPVKLPTLVKTYDYTSREAQAANTSDPTAIVPNTVIRPDGHGLLKTLLQAPLCYKAGGTSHGTLKALAHWCPAAHTDLRLHFAKTGTSVTEDPNSTVDTWITGGLQFANGAAYSYVVLVGTGSAQEPWARSLHASQAAVPLLEALLADLAAHARTNPGPLPKPAAAIAPEIAKPAPPREREDWKSRVFQTQ